MFDSLFVAMKIGSVNDDWDWSIANKGNIYLYNYHDIHKFCLKIFYFIKYVVAFRSSKPHMPLGYDYEMEKVGLRDHCTMIHSVCVASLLLCSQETQHCSSHVGATYSHNVLSIILNCRTFKSNFLN